MARSRSRRRTTGVSRRWGPIEVRRGAKRHGAVSINGKTGYPRPPLTTRSSSKRETSRPPREPRDGQAKAGVPRASSRIRKRQRGQGTAAEERRTESTERSVGNRSVIPPAHHAHRTENPQSEPAEAGNPPSLGTPTPAVPQGLCSLPSRASDTKRFTPGISRPAGSPLLSPAGFRRWAFWGSAARQDSRHTHLQKGRPRKRPPLADMERTGGSAQNS